MTTELIIVVLLAWTVVGVLAAIVFGKMIQASDAAPEDDDAVPASADTVSYFRRNKRKPATAAGVRHATAKRMTG